LANLLEALHHAGLPLCDLDTLLAPATQRGVALSFDDGIIEKGLGRRPQYFAYPYGYRRARTRLCARQLPRQRHDGTTGNLGQ
jgi:hypothetical protein